MNEALTHALWEGLLDRLVSDIPTWSVWDPQKTWGLASWGMFPEWFRYVRMGLDAGYYGLASVRFDQKGPGGETDHIVLICGAREKSIPIEEGGKTLGYRIDQEILVSCSSTSSPPEEWIETKKFLLERGGFNIILVRPSYNEAS
jgi:hypothetical protein